jgi:outer membrane receptor protein involved in Fe transport
LPEFIHSVEFGCKFQNDEISVLPGIYYRNTRNRFTSITQVVNDSTLLTTKQNLSTDQSTGVEFVVSITVGDLLTAHANANAYYNQIDASNLGYSSKRSTWTRSGAFTFNINVTMSTMLQVNSNFTSSRLTPQGENRPSYVINLGLRQELLSNKLSLVATVADLFKTQKRELELNTSLLNQNVINKRDSRVIYLGLTYHFGTPAKKSKEESLHYDDSL